MKKNLLPAIAVIAIASCAQAHADTIANWTFETSAPVTAGPLSPEVGAGSALGFHANGSAVYSSPVGNGSSHSFSSNNWSVGDYYQFQVSAANFTGLTLTYDQIGSSTGPRDFELEYSTNGTTFTNFGSYTVLSNSSPNVWSSTPANHITTSTYTDDLTSIDDLNGAATVYFRLANLDTTAINGGTTASTGTDRVDNVIITGTAIAAPEPSSWILGGLAIGSFALLRRRMAGSVL